MSLPDAPDRKGVEWAVEVWGKCLDLKDKYISKILGTQLGYFLLHIHYYVNCPKKTTKNIAARKLTSFSEVLDWQDVISVDFSRLIEKSFTV